jgi:hypothetical protein
MKEGWYNDHYLVLFDEQEEAARMAESYGIAQYLPGYSLVGISGWDNFVVQDAQHQLFIVPTVPMDSQHLSPIALPIDSRALKPDGRFQKKIKWYVQPIVFGGDPQAEHNMTWLSIEQHTEAVRWWNRKYCEIKQQQKGA